MTIPADTAPGTAPNTPPSRAGTAGTAATARASVRARVPVTLARVRDRSADLITFHDLPDPGEHFAIVVPAPPAPVAATDARPAAAEAPLVRLHSECLTGDVLGSARCDCGPQLDEALQYLAEQGGALLYLRQEGRGIGLYNKLDTYVLQQQDYDTFAANRMIGRGDDERDYGAAAAMLRALGLTRIRLLTNNPAKVQELREHGIEITEVLPTGVYVTPENARYLSAKAELGGHHLPRLQETAA
ncbi:GTP cyclohydrolase II RibA [Streptomyces sp. NBC_01408]|uniref:GTP cyclohydrolase II RibA n=1 Tax=Streptomyces sp. NBC_01408 TaxID=2903855 RepID=UPI00224EE719|nr:GTP cyclohydrolase II RibA [Streptomyces sp. NBC_01408]MCX4696583.1 GTP cyclohydrolase II RibA [Streptomyces sp. NBC_01408]